MHTLKMLSTDATKSKAKKKALNLKKKKKLFYGLKQDEGIGDSCKFLWIHVTRLSTVNMWIYLTQHVRRKLYPEYKLQVAWGK
jgi:hypothetical protein